MLHSEINAEIEEKIRQVKKYFKEILSKWFDLCDKKIF